VETKEGFWGWYLEEIKECPRWLESEKDLLVGILMVLLFASVLITIGVVPIWVLFLFPTIHTLASYQEWKTKWED